MRVNEVMSPQVKVASPSSHQRSERWRRHQNRARLWAAPGDAGNHHFATVPLMRGSTAALLVALLVAGTAAVLIGCRHLPPAYDPWAVLKIEDPPNLFTRFKLSRLSRDPAQCLSVLATAPLTYVRLDDAVTGEACGFHNAVRIDRTSSQVGTPFSLTCRTAVSLALWERHVVGLAARKHFGSEVRELEHFGSYSCRNVYGRPRATRSRHAMAEALDVAGFALTDGRRVRVLGDWSAGTPESRFLREIRDGACRFFDAVLSPDFNAAHADHLHLDRGPYRACR
jgi:hypothetical protein